MRHTLMRGSGRWLALVLAAAAVHEPATAQDPDYSAYTATAFIPFAPDHINAAMPFTNTVGLTFRVGERVFHGTMDTGTTGVLLPAYLVPGYDASVYADSAPGWQFLSSSRLLRVGHWVVRDLTFRGLIDKPVTTRVPVLAVEQEVRCVGYIEGKDGYGPACPPHARVVTGPDTLRLCRSGRVLPDGSPCVYNFHPPDSVLAYVGVGFGRELDGQPQGTPDRNPLLNVTVIGTDSVLPGQMRTGYIITGQGVHVGLTPGDTPGFTFTRLQPLMLPTGDSADPDTASRIPRDWGPATVCISIDGSACEPGAMLVDTGVDEMFLNLPRSIPFQPDRVIDPSTCDSVDGLPGGSRVRVSFLNGADSVAGYAFAVGDSTNSTAPSTVMPQYAHPTFVNTGRHLLRAFDVLLDADGGFFGVRSLPRRVGRPITAPGHCGTSARGSMGRHGDGHDPARDPRLAADDGG